MTTTREEIDLGYVPCACMCGEEANEIYNGVPVCFLNPIQHYTAWQMKFGSSEQARERVKSLLDRFMARSETKQKETKLEPQEGYWDWRLKARRPITMDDATGFTEGQI